jgi:hypothetical protein
MGCFVGHALHDSMRMGERGREGWMDGLREGDQEGRRRVRWWWWWWWWRRRRRRRRKGGGGLIFLAASRPVHLKTLCTIRGGDSSSCQDSIRMSCLLVMHSCLPKGGPPFLPSTHESCPTRMAPLMSSRRCTATRCSALLLLSLLLCPGRKRVKSKFRRPAERAGGSGKCVRWKENLQAIRQGKR